MGLTKQRLANGEHACSECFGDADLADFVETHAESDTCSFCNRIAETPIAARIEDIAARIEDRLAEEYDDPGNCMGWDGREGGWIGSNTWSTWELLKDTVEMKDGNDALFEAIYNAIGDKEWCKRNPYGLNYREQISTEWNNFCRLIMHGRRHFFSLRTRSKKKIHSEQESDPVQVLARVAEFCKQYGLIRPLERGTLLVRARLQGKGERFTDRRTLGPPPPHLCLRANRMSPPGIPMFYAAEDLKTAIAELDSQSGIYAVGEFKPTKNVFVLDLSEIPKAPGLFSEPSDSAERNVRAELGFLNSFGRQMTQRTTSEERAPLEYVPTQVVAEYFRHAVHHKRRHVLGIKYKSSRAGGGTCVALFADQDSLFPGRDEDLITRMTVHLRKPWIRLVRNWQHKVPKAVR